MKNSKHYAAKIRTLYHSLKRSRAAVKKVAYQDPADALVYAIVSEGMAQAAAQTAVRRLTQHFIDCNDLRVSRTEEMLDVLGQDNPATRAIASRLSAALQYIFYKYNTASLKLLAGIGKRPAKQALEKIEGTSRFMVNYVMLTSLRGHAMPLTAGMIEYLRTNGLVYPTADDENIEGFLERQVPASRAYEFYTLLRRESEKRPKRPRKKTHTSAKTQKRAAKKPKTKSRTKKAKKKK